MLGSLCERRPTVEARKLEYEYDRPPTPSLSKKRKTTIKHSRPVFESTASTPQLPFKTPQIPSTGDHTALNRGTLGGLGVYRSAEPFNKRASFYHPEEVPQTLPGMGRTSASIPSSLAVTYLYMYLVLYLFNNLSIVLFMWLATPGPPEYPAE